MGFYIDVNRAMVVKKMKGGEIMKFKEVKNLPETCAIQDEVAFGPVAN